jgi:hypothetical protein
MIDLRELVLDLNEGWAGSAEQRRGEKTKRRATEAQFLEILASSGEALERRICKLREALEHPGLYRD